MNLYLSSAYYIIRCSCIQLNTCKEHMYLTSNLILPSLLTRGVCTEPLNRVPSLSRRIGMLIMLCNSTFVYNSVNMVLYTSIVVIVK